MKEKILKDFKEIKPTIADEKDIKLIEAITKMHDGAINRSFWKSPLLPIIISALLGTGGIILGKIYDTNQINRNRTKELETDLIIKAVETTDLETSKRNLKFLADAKLISDPNWISQIQELAKDSSFIFETLETQKAINLISDRVDNLNENQQNLDSLFKALLTQNNELQKKSQEAEESNSKLLATVSVFEEEVHQLKQRPELRDDPKLTQLNKTSEELKLELQKQSSTIQQQQQQQQLQNKGLSKFQQQQQQQQPLKMKQKRTN